MASGISHVLVPWTIFDSRLAACCIFALLKHRAIRGAMVRLNPHGILHDWIEDLLIDQQRKRPGLHIDVLVLSGVISMEMHSARIMLNRCSELQLHCVASC